MLLWKSYWGSWHSQADGKRREVAILFSCSSSKEQRVTVNQRQERPRVSTRNTSTEAANTYGWDFLMNRSRGVKRQHRKEHRLWNLTFLLGH